MPMTTPRLFPINDDVNLGQFDVREYGAIGRGENDDTDAFHSAMIAAGTNGTVFVPPGTYICQLEIIESGLTLVGSGLGAIIKAPDSVTSSTPAPVKILADGVILENLTIDGNRANGTEFDDDTDAVTLYANRCIVRNCEIINWIGHGVIAWDRAYTGTRGSASAAARSGCRVTHNTFRNVTGNVAFTQASAIDFADGIPDSTTPVNEATIITNNTLIGPTDTNGNGITFHTAMRGIIANNVLQDWTEAGISVHSGSTDTVVDSNFIEGSRLYAIRIQGAGNNRIVASDNIVINATETGFRVQSDNTVIEGNIVFNSTEQSILFRGDNLHISDNIFIGGSSTTAHVQVDGASEGLIFTDNTIDGGADGIAFTIGASLTEGDISHNRIANVGSVGLFVSAACDHLNIESNQIAGGTSDCVRCSSSAHSRVTIKNNHLIGGVNAVELDGGTDVRIEDNFMVDQTDTAIKTVVQTKIINNTIDNPTLHGVLLETGSGDTDIRENLIKNASDGVNINASLTGVVIEQNRFESLSSLGVDGTLTNVTIRNNVGFVTENSGTGSIASGTTSDVIAHGLAVTPTADQIIITLTENPTNTPGAIWVDTIGGTNFTVNCENDPGASNLDFSWRVVPL